MTLNVIKKLVLSLLSIVMILGLQAREIIVSEDVNTGIEVSHNTYQQLRFSSTLGQVQVNKVNTEMGVFNELGIFGYSSSNIIGEPKLPMNRKLIEIPFGASPEVQLISFKVQEYSLEELGMEFQLIPAQPSAPKDGTYVPFEYNEAAYNLDAYTSTELVSVEVLGVMRGLRIARIDVAPVQYNPVTGMIRIYTEIEAEIVFSGADVMTTLEEKTKNQAPYFRSVGASLLNYKHEEPSTRDTLTRYPVKFVIVSDRMFETQLQPLVEWKTKKGFTVVEAYTDVIGNTTSSIKSYLQGLYDAGTVSDPAPSFVLFVGDIAQIPSWSGNTGGHVTDLMYVEYTGDYFPEVYFGRMSANNTTELQPQIDKTLQYEQYTMPDPSYLDEVLMVGGMDSGYGHDWANGQINYGTENYFNMAHGLTSHTYLYPESGSHAADIIQNVSDGVSFGNYTAHCSASGWANPSFSISNIASLQNQDEYCVLIGNCCSSNEFDVTCFGEAILRAENKGAVAYIGGTNSTYWDEDYYFGVGVGTISEDPPSYAETTLGNYDRSFHDHGEGWEDWYTTSYQMIFAGNLAVTESGASLTEYYWEIYCVMGDPSLMCYFGVPDPISVSYDPLMILGVTSFTVTTEPYAYVAISKDGVLYGAALADAAGLANVSLVPITTPGEANVVVTKQNGAPYIGTVLVNNPSGPYIALNDFTVNDPTGNVNGKADYGETINLDVVLENIGNSDATDVTAVISTSDEYVSISDDNQAWGTIVAGATSAQMDAYTFVVDAVVPNLHIVNFDIDITGTGKDNWSENFGVTLYAPVLATGYASVDDSQVGNNNGRLDPGETAEIIIPVLNGGQCDAMNAIADMTSSSTDIVINTASVNVGTIAIGLTEQVVFNVSVDEDAEPGTSIPFEFNIDAEGYTAVLNFYLVAGQIPVLVIDLDPNFSSGLVMKNCLSNLTVGADYMTSVPNNLEMYSSVFVCLGVYSANHHLSSADGQDLADYLDGGGNLYMEGGDTWYFDDQTAVHPMFGITGMSDGSNDLGTLLGLDGTFTEGLIYTYVGENNWIDQIEPNGTAYSILSNQVPAYVTGVANIGSTYRTIGCSHEFGGIADNDFTKNYLMYKYLEFFGIEAVWVGLEEISLDDNMINIFPNPVTNVAKIYVNVLESGNLNISVFNSTGQEISRPADSQNVGAGEHAFEFDASALAGGIYYCVVSSGNQKVSKKVVVIK